MKNSIADKILKELLRPRFRYKGMSVNFLGLPAFREDYSPKSFSNSFNRLMSRELIEREGEFLRITQRGREYVKRRQESLLVFSLPFPKTAPKNLIVMFDIPEEKKAEREWFRFHLRKFGYIMIQKSVWVGPSPLPKSFLDYVEEIELKDCIKTFKLAKPYKISNE